MSNQAKVEAFHKKFAVKIGTIGYLPSAERALLRVRLISEEFAEVVEAIQTEDYVNIAKELADLLYVVYGTAVEYGIPLDAVFDEVHTANMTKTPAKDAGGKVQKGPDYKAADVAAVLDREVRDGNRVR